FPFDAQRLPYAEVDHSGSNRMIRVRGMDHIQQAVKCFYKRAVPQLETKARLIAQAPHQQCRMIFIPLHRSRKSTVLRGYFRGVLIKITCMLTAGHGQSYYYCQVMAVRLVQYSAYTGSVPG